MEHENNYVKEVLTMQGIMGRVRGSSFHECVLRVHFWTVCSKRLCSLHARANFLTCNLTCGNVHTQYVGDIAIIVQVSCKAPLMCTLRCVWRMRMELRIYIPIAWEQYGSALSIGTRIHGDSDTGMQSAQFNVPEAFGIHGVHMEQTTTFHYFIGIWDSMVPKLLCMSSWDISLLRE